MTCYLTQFKNNKLGVSLSSSLSISLFGCLHDPDIAENKKHISRSADCMEGKHTFDNDVSYVNPAKCPTANYVFTVPFISSSK